MAANWQLANGGGFQNALATGLQIGQGIRQRQQEESTRNALSAYMDNPNQDNAAFAKTTQGLPADAAIKLYQLREQQQQGVAKLEADKREAAAKSIPTQINMLTRARQDPSIWPELRSEAIRLGFGTEQSLPASADAGWIDTRFKVLSAMQEQPDLMTAEAKNIMLSLPPEQRDPNNPAFIAAMGRAAEKVITTTAGGGAFGYNQSTGQSRVLIAPNTGAAPAGTPVGSAPSGAAPTTKTLNGKTYYNYGGTWHDEPMGGGGSNVTGNF